MEHGPPGIQGALSRTLKDGGDLQAVFELMERRPGAGVVRREGWVDARALALEHPGPPDARHIAAVREGSSVRISDGHECFEVTVTHVGRAARPEDIPFTGTVSGYLARGRETGFTLGSTAEFQGRHIVSC